MVMSLLVLMLSACLAHSFCPPRASASAPNPSASKSLVRIRQLRAGRHHQRLAVQPNNKYEAFLASSIDGAEYYGFTVDASVNHNNDSDAADYFIQRVTTKARALDVRIFRGFSITAEEYVLEQRQVGNNDNIISKNEAIDLMMKDYDENGDYIYKYVADYESEAYFVAVYNGTRDELRDEFAGPDGVIGVVSAQLRRRSPLTDDSVIDDKDSIPSAHVYLANMRVHDEMRRRGVGLALISSVREYVDSWSVRMDEEIPCVLSVDNDNFGGIRLYERGGFSYLHGNDEYCTMIAV